MKKICLKITKIIWLLLAIVVIVMAILFGIMRAATPYLSKYKTTIIQKVNQSIPVNIAIDDFNIAWYHFSPVISLNNIKVYASDKHLITTINKAYVGINLFTLLKTHKAIPNKVIVSNADLVIPIKLVKKLELDAHQRQTTSKKNKAWIKALSLLDEVALKKIKITFTEGNTTSTVLEGDFLLNHKIKQFRLQGSILNRQNDTSVNFISTLQPNLKQLLNSNVKGYLELENFDSAKFARYFKLNTPIETMIKHGKVWFALDHKHVISAAADITAENTMFSFNSIETRKTLPELKFSMLYRDRKDKGEKLLAINNLSFSDAASNLNLLVQMAQEKSSRKVNFVLRDLDLNTKAFLAKFVIKNKKIATLLSKIKPKLTLTHMRGELTLTGHAIENYHLQLAADDISLHAYQKIPGITHVSLQADLERDKGKATLSFNNTLLDMPWLFRRTNTITQGEGEVNWAPSHQQIQIKTHGKLVFPEGEVYPSMRLTLGGGAPVKLALLADAKATSLTSSNVYGYLPVAIMPDEVINWLDSSTKKVGPTTAKLILRSSDITDFPFDQQQGVFLIQAKTQNSTLHFYDGWPTIKQINANLTFNNRAMNIHVKHAETEGVTITTANAVIPEMGAANGTVLNISADGNGSLNSGLSYLMHSPIANNINALNELNVGGGFNSKLTVEIPISHLDEISPTVTGSAWIKNGMLKYNARALSLNHINGEIKFKDALISSNKINAYLGDKPVTIHVEPVPHTKHAATKVNLSGSFSIAELNKYLPNKLPSYISGAAIILGSVIFDKQNGFTIALQSDLKGIRVNLPAPLGKSENQSSTFTLMINDVAKNIRQVLLNYQNVLSTNLYFQENKNKMSLSKGVVYVGQRKKITMPAKGINLMVTLPVTDVQAWYTWYQQNVFGKNASNLSGILNRAVLNIDKLTFLDQSLLNLSITLKPYAHYTVLNISSNRIVGMINLPSKISAQTPITIKLKKLYYQAPKLKPTQKAVKATALTKYYNVDFNCDDLRYNKMQLGRVSGKMRTTASNDLVIKPLNASSANYQLNSQLAWRSAKNQTELSGQFKSANTSAFLLSVGLPGKIYSKNAKANFQLNWPGFLSQFNLSRLNGTLSFNVENGKLSGLSKSTNAKVGLGTIITSLNIESLPNRITSSFHDNGELGFNFKSIEANFNLKNGNLLTQRAYLESTVAYISLKGRIGLVSEDLDLVMAIVPHLTASLPVIATIAGGPVAGVATWVIDKAISPEVNKISQYNYTVTGSWKNPVIQKK